MALKLAVAAAGSVAAADGRALMALPPLVVALAQPAASTTGTAAAASAIWSRLDAIMTMRRAPAHRGSSRQHRSKKAGLDMLNDDSTVKDK